MSAHDLLPASHRPPPGPLPVARRLIVTWQHPEQRAIQPVGRLTFDGSVYRFAYIRNALNIPDFRPFIGFPDLSLSYESHQLFPLFAQRAMDPRRPDFQRYVSRLGLAEDTTPWEQIAFSGGRREGDTLQLFPEPSAHDGVITCAFLVHGIRWIGSRPIRLRERIMDVSRSQVEQALEALSPGDPLLLVAEPTNPVNKEAVLTTYGSGTPLGYVPDLLVADLQRLMQESTPEVRVQVVNGADAPWHLRLMARLNASDPGGFQFFRGEIWEPVAVPGNP